MPSNHLMLCRPLLLLPSIFPSIRVFSNELTLHIRWPKYWSFSISPSSEHSGLISFRIDWFDFLSVQGSKHMKVAQSCLTLCDPMDCTVHEILQASILKWVAFPSSRGSSQPRNRTQVSPLQADSFPTELCGKRRKMLHGAIAIICQSDALKVKNSLENPISSCQVGSCSKLCLLNHLGN